MAGTKTGFREGLHSFLGHLRAAGGNELWEFREASSERIGLSPARTRGLSGRIAQLFVHLRTVEGIDTTGISGREMWAGDEEDASRADAARAQRMEDTAPSVPRTDTVRPAFGTRVQRKRRARGLGDSREQSSVLRQKGMVRAQASPDCAASPIQAKAAPLPPVAATGAARCPPLNPTRSPWRALWTKRGAPMDCGKNHAALNGSVAESRIVLRSPRRSKSTRTESTETSQITAARAGATPWARRARPSPPTVSLL